MNALSARLQPIFHATRIVCFGRLQLEVPITATVVFGPTDAPATIVRLAGEAPKLADHLARRLDEIEADKDMVATSRKEAILGRGSLYGKVVDGIREGQKIVVGQTQGIFYKLESFIPLGQDLYIQETQAIPAPTSSASGPGDSVANALSMLNTVAQHLRPRRDDEVPTDAGICIDGGFIAFKDEQKFENFALGVRLKEFPDVHLSIDAIRTKFAQFDSDSIEARLQQAKADAESNGTGTWYARINFLRRGPRELNGWHGYEALARKPAHQDMRENHEFLFLSPGEVQSSLKPRLDIQMNTGVAENRTAVVLPSLSDSEALDVWDRITSTVRTREVISKKDVSKSDANSFPLGTLAVTGRICPASGWWECDQPGLLPDARRKLIREGEKMPYVTYTSEPTVWQKLKGEKPSHRVGTMWTLVEHDSTPNEATPPQSSRDPG